MATTLQKLSSYMGERLMDDVYGPKLIQSDGTVVPYPDKEDRFTDEYDIYSLHTPFYPFWNGSRQYHKSDTVRGPKILRPFKHWYHEAQWNPGLLNYLSIFGNTIKDYFTDQAPNIGHLQFIHNNEQKNKKD